MNRTKSVLLCALISGIISIGSAAGESFGQSPGSPRIGTFSLDITIPIGHRCMGVLKTKSNRIDDPLEAHGFVLVGAGQPVVLLALDWCEVRNGAYDQWRDALAEAANTTRQHVLLCSLHQHDAPVTDRGAQAYLDDVGLERELYDVAFEQECIERAVAAVRNAVDEAVPLTHVGVAQANVEKIASNRRVVYPDGSVRFDRYSRMGGDTFAAQADDGEIDPMLKSITFYSKERAVAVVSCYATHPMSHYGDGAVSADFVGMARRRRQRETPGTKQIYVSGCSGDVTAGKYNDGSPAMRAVLADRLYQAMRDASAVSDKQPVDGWDFRCETMELPFHEGDELKREALTRGLQDEEAATEDRILAAMGLSSLDRVERGQPIDLPCLQLGTTRFVLLPGEAFVGYQLMSQRLRPHAFVMAIGYGECWTGYIPTEQAYQEGFGHGWRWVGRGCEAIIREALDRVLGADAHP